MSSTTASYVRWFSDLSLGDVPLVGGKNASLGEMYRELVPLGVKVPNGFAVTAEAYRKVLADNDLDGPPARAAGRPRQDGRQRLGAPAPTRSAN